LKSLAVYKEVLEGQPVRAETTPAHLELELSGLVKRDAAGRLVLRNPIYTRLFDRRWLATTAPMRTVARDRRRLRYAGVAVAASLLGAAWLGYGYLIERDIAAEQTQIARGFETLAARGITITGDAQSGFALDFPDDALQALLGEALAAIPDRSAIRSLNLSGTQVADLAPLAGLTGLQWLDLAGTQVADLAPWRASPASRSWPSLIRQ
jgi:Leucine-rich repeat (LRR) protein